MDEKLFSVSEYLEFLNEIFKKCKARVVGEVSGFNVGPTGHVYFSLKDEKDQSVLKCIIWKSKYNLCGVNLEDGMKVISYGAPSLHGQYGFSFVAETIELAGEGALRKEYEKLKQKLEKEGLFAEEMKRKIPSFAQKIGVITSKQGAVLADFLNNLGKFGFQVQMIDSRVEGQAATADLLASVKTFRKKDIDVLVIMRGGGDLESFLAFNNELLVREIAGFPVPIIAGIGHHKDEPLVAMVADLAVSTPTAAARELSRSFEEAIFVLDRQEKQIINSYQESIDNAKILINNGINVVREGGYLIFKKYEKIENSLMVALEGFQSSLKRVKADMQNSFKIILSGFYTLSKKTEQKLNYTEKMITIYNPASQLKMGYSLAFSNGKLIRKTEDIIVGQDMTVRVSDGEINSKIIKIN